MPKVLAVLASGFLAVVWAGCDGDRAKLADINSATLSGNWHGSCAIDVDETLWCWGTFGGPSGDARSAPSGTPRRISDERWSEVAVGTSHACALRADGSLWCWGRNCAGQLGDGTRDDRGEPTRVGQGTSWRHVAVGGGHSCAIDDAGALFCWGGADYGQQFCDPSSPVPPARLDGEWRAVSSHYYATHAILADGSLWRWQDESYASASSAFAHAEHLGHSTWRSIATGVGFVCGVREDGRLACIEDEDVAETVIGEDDDWSGSIAASYHACAIKLDGTLWCVGANVDGQLGTGTKSLYEGVPVQVGNDADWTAVSAGGASSCGQRADGSLWCWGGNESGELGIGDFPYRPAPAQVGSDTGWSSPTVGYHFSCAIRDGQLHCWGGDQQGQLGLDVGGDQLVPTALPGTWSQVSAASFSACAIDGGKGLWCWGAAGLGGSDQRCAIGEETWAALSTGEERTCALDDTGLASCWSSGYLLDVAPTPLPGHTWSSLASSYGHTCGVMLDGRLACWGQNRHGELGTGDTVDLVAPTEVAGGGQWLAVTAGNGGVAGAGGYTCAIRDDHAGAGRLYCWGGGAFGRLGNGSDASAVVPTQVGNDADWTQVSAGPVRACAIKRSGQLWCWGRNDDGGLGVGAADSLTHAPERVGAGSHWAEVAVRFHTCATASDGGLWCWGWGGGGELGDGSAWRLEPTRAIIGTIVP